MRTLVRFRAGGHGYAVDVDAVEGVLPRGPVDPLPAPRPGVIGLLRDPTGALPLVAPFGRDGEHVLVLRGASGRYGLLVEEVERVVRVAPEQVAPAPAGQQDEQVIGLVDGRMLLDAVRLHRHLGDET